MPSLLHLPPAALTLLCVAWEDLALSEKPTPRFLSFLARRHHETSRNVPTKTGADIS